MEGRVTFLEARDYRRGPRLIALRGRFRDLREDAIKLCGESLERILAFVGIGREHRARLLVRQRGGAVRILRHVEANWSLDGRGHARGQHPSRAVTSGDAQEPIPTNLETCGLSALRDA